MTAAELLRDLDERATGAPWKPDFNVYPYEVDGMPGIVVCDVADEPDCGDGKADARLIATTRNLLPQLAALVEAVGAYAEARDAMTNAIVIGRDSEDAIDALNVAKWSAHDAMLTALSALNAAAKEQA